MKKVLITGGAGFIGKKLAAALKEKGFEITILDNLNPQVHGSRIEQVKTELEKEYTFIYGDVLNLEDFKKAARGNRVIVHLAAETGTGQSMYNVSNVFGVNTMGTGNLVHLLLNRDAPDVRKIILSSSRAVYGEGRYRCPDHGIVFPGTRDPGDLASGMFNCRCPECGQEIEPLPTTEDSKMNPASVYALSKCQQEQMLDYACRLLSIPLVIFRYQNVYGPGQSLSNPYTGILSIFSSLIMNGLPLNIFEDGKESRDFVFIDDVVKATVRGIEMPEGDNRVFNVGTGKPLTILDIADELTGSFGVAADYVISGDYRVGDIRHNHADISRLKNLLGFVPGISFHEGIRSFTGWVRQQDPEKNRFEKSLDEMRQAGFLKSSK
jgi:dTDP-L-rhamnose 4-epimerase